MKVWHWLWTSTNLEADVAHNKRSRAENSTLKRAVGTVKIEKWTQEANRPNQEEHDDTTHVVWKNEAKNSVEKMRRSKNQKTVFFFWELKGL